MTPTLSIDRMLPFTIAVDGRRRRITPGCWRLLLALARHPGRYVADDELISAVYADRATDACAYQLAWFVSHLRRAVAPVPITRLHRTGYILHIPPAQIDWDALTPDAPPPGSAPRPPDPAMRPLGT